MKVQDVLQNKFTTLVAQLGVAAVELSSAQKKYDTILARITALKDIAPEIESLETVANGKEKTNTQP